MKTEKRLQSGGNTGATKPASYSHLKSVKGGVSMHAAVRKMAETRRREEGYHSLSAYLAGLVVFDFYCSRRHWLTAQLMDESLDTQEKVFAELLENRHQRSTWFEHRIEEIINEKKQ